MQDLQQWQAAAEEKRQPLRLQTKYKITKVNDGMHTKNQKNSQKNRSNARPVAVAGGGCVDVRSMLSCGVGSKYWEIKIFLCF